MATLGTRTVSERIDNGETRPELTQPDTQASADPALVVMGLHLRGLLNRKLLAQCVEEINRRHDVLLTAQAVADAPLLAEQSIAALADVEEIVHHEQQRSQVPSIRWLLLDLSSQEHVLLTLSHRSIADEYSLRLLSREICALYHALVAGRSSPLPPLDLRYSALASRQRARIGDADVARQLQDWKERFASRANVMQLPTDRPRPAGPHYSEGLVQLKLSAEMTEALRALSGRQGVPLLASLLSAWLVLLGRWSSQRSGTVGVRLDNRGAGHYLVGPFEITAQLNVDWNADTSMAQLLGWTAAMLAEAQPSAHLPLERLITELDGNTMPAVQAVLRLDESHPLVASMPMQSDQLAIDELRIAGLHTSQELTLTLLAEAGGLSGTLAYARELFDQATVERIAAGWQVLLAAMIADIHQPVSLVPILTPAERTELLLAFNDTARAHPRERLVHELFEDQVSRTPEAIAVVHGTQQLTYAALNARANQLARHLRLQGVCADSVVAICLERGADIPVAVLGVLKAGGAYVPLDPSYPRARLEHMLSDSSPSVLITQKSLQSQLAETGVNVVLLDDAWDAIAALESSNLTDTGVSPRNLAYVIYTSGSTGVPKGVMLEHSGLCNLTSMLKRRMETGTDSRVLQFASLSFDACTWEVVMALGSGAALCMASRDDLAPGEPLLQTLVAQKITHATLPPVALGTVAPSNDLSLRTLVVAGEACSPSLARDWSAGRRFINAYGPTEATVCASMRVCDGTELRNVPIGGPIDNAQIYILDSQLQPTPIGVAGEIYIGGAGIARGYLRRPELTAERFIASPFAAQGSRLYKSGDLGRWLPDGGVEFLGRNDDQVKIRGFRIELGEIEERLQQHPNVQEAVVLAVEDGAEKRLVAYVTARDQSSPSAEDLRAHLSDLLPSYMVPSAYVVLDSFPLTPSGKLDRRALPAPGDDAYVRRDYEPPRGDVEVLLAEVWRELLGIERVGRNDNFFELGGQSLLIVRMLDLLHASGLSVDVNKIFVSPTLADLASALDGETNEPATVAPSHILQGCSRITPDLLSLVTLSQDDIDWIAQSVPGGAENIQDIYPLTPLQEGILFHHKLDNQGWDTYVIPVLLGVSSKPELDVLIQALQHTVDRHDTLRTAVISDKLPQPVQVVYRHAHLPVEEVTLDASRDTNAQLQEWLRPEKQKLDLRRAPLLRLQVAADPHSQRWYALLLHHHSIADHASVEIILDEIREYIDGDVRLLPKPLAYRDHVARILEHVRAQDDEQFFRTKLGDIEAPTASFGLLNVRGDGRRIEQFNQPLESRLAQRVRRLARQMEVSAATLFHAAWAVVVARTSGRDDVVFGTVLFGRLKLSASAQRCVGLFVNTLPLRLRLTAASAREFIEQTQRELVELLDHEQASLSLAQRCSRTVGDTPLFNSLLNYLHSGVPVETGQPMIATGVQVLAAKEWTNYPITISVADQGEGFVLDVATDRQIHPQRIVVYMQTAVKSLVEMLEDSPHRSISDVAILPPDESRRLIETFNSDQMAYPREKLIHELFEEQVMRTPDVVAVLYGSESLTYAELNARANRLARYLRVSGVGPDRLVGICVERGLPMVVALLGTLKAGGAYVPLDPNYPAERLKYMLADSSPQIVVTQERLVAALPADVTRLISLDGNADVLERYEDQDIPRSETGLSAEDLLYVIYTSGSTGRPKGTAMAHRPMVNLIEWHRRSVDARPGQRVLQFAALSFDVAFQETFSTLCTGGTLVLIDEWERRDVRALTDVLRRQQVERLFIPPLMLQSVAEHLATEDVPPLTNLRDVVTAGEQLRITAEVSALFERLPGCRLHNHYGPTETHVVTALTMSDGAGQWPLLPTIGRPIPNSRIYLLDEAGRPSPMGVTGEICIGGEGVARGYLGRPELTAQRFVADPFARQPGARLYRTGDVGRWTSEGTIEYLGRDDDQVKIRGYRIELGEIETQLSRHPRVKAAAVTARDDVGTAKRLVAYVTLHAAANDDALDLRAYLQATLPEYMVPAAFVIIDEFPLSPNGKLDRRALPEPDISACPGDDYEAPQGEIETAVAEVWSRLLKMDRIGRRDNFFELGGHSLLATRVVAQIARLFDVQLSLRSVFERPTIEGLSASIVAAVMDELEEAV